MIDILSWYLAVLSTWEVSPLIPFFFLHQQQRVGEKQRSAGGKQSWPIQTPNSPTISFTFFHPGIGTAIANRTEPCEPNCATMRLHWLNNIQQPSSWIAGPSQFYWPHHRIPLHSAAPLSTASHDAPAGHGSMKDQEDKPFKPRFAEGKLRTTWFWQALLYILFRLKDLMVLFCWVLSAVQAQAQRFNCQ